MNESLMNETNEKSGENETTDGQSRNYVNKKWAFAAGILSMPLYWVFASRDDPGRGVAGACAVVAIVLTVRYRWDLRKRTWFWTTIAFLVLLHVFLLLHFQWPHTNLPGIALLPYAMLDVAFIYGCIKLVEKAANWS
jgi:hypothetical protein